MANTEWLDQQHANALLDDTMRDSESALHDAEVACDLLRMGLDDYGLFDKPVESLPDLHVTARPMAVRLSRASETREQDNGSSSYHDFLAVYDFRD